MRGGQWQQAGCGGRLASRQLRMGPPGGRASARKPLPLPVPVPGVPRTKRLTSASAGSEGDSPPGRGLLWAAMEVITSWMSARAGHGAWHVRNRHHGGQALPVPVPCWAAAAVQARRHALGLAQRAAKRGVTRANCLHRRALLTVHRASNEVPAADAPPAHGRPGTVLAWAPGRGAASLPVNNHLLLPK